jgi:type IV pilus assembly protein PilC
MPVFEYEVADPTGALSRGRAEAVDSGALIGRLREQGRQVVSIQPAVGAALGRETGLAAAGEGVRRAFQRVSSGVKLATLLMFTGQLSAMLGGGLHLARILTSLAAETTSKHFKRVLEEVGEAITAGESLASALERHPYVFDRMYVEVVRAGEVSGSLPTVLETLNGYLEKTAQLRRKVMGALSYPLVILTVAVLIVVVMMVKLVPIFEGVYTRMNAQLPAPTRLLIAVSHAVQDFLLLIGLGVLGVLVFGYLGVQTQRGRWLLDRVKLSVPIFGPLIRKAVMARTCRTLSVLLNAGIPLLDALETVAAGICGNTVIEEALETAARGMEHGGTIAATLRRTGEFPTMLIQLVATGEETGTLPAMLARAAGYYEQQVDNVVATLSSLIEPVMIVLMGAVAGGVIFALYLPIFSLGQAMRGGVK